MTNEGNAVPSGAFAEGFLNFLNEITLNRNKTLFDFLLFFFTSVLELYCQTMYIR
jgi:hypothetical protein